jgi:hypothetical protein
MTIFWSVMVNWSWILSKAITDNEEHLKIKTNEANLAFAHIKMLII